MEPRWLKLKAACQYSALGKARLIDLAQQGQVRGFQDPESGRGDWIFDRLSIDEYRLGQAKGADCTAQAKEFLREVGL
jgi:hypothetical protein